jgi:hypothetical protein
VHSLEVIICTYQKTHGKTTIKNSFVRLIKPSGTVHKERNLVQVSQSFQLSKKWMLAWTSEKRAKILKIIRNSAEEHTDMNNYVLEQQIINLQHLELESVDCINLAEEVTHGRSFLTWKSADFNKLWKYIWK